MSIDEMRLLIMHFAKRSALELGQSLTEYALIIGLLVMATLAALLSLGRNLQPTFKHTVNCLVNSAGC